MSAIEYNNLLRKISQRLDDINSGQQLLVICSGMLAVRNEESIPTLSLFLELEEKGFLSPDRLTVLKTILKGVKEWAFLEKVEKFEQKRKELFNNLVRVFKNLVSLHIYFSAFLDSLGVTRQTFSKSILNKARVSPLTIKQLRNPNH